MISVEMNWRSTHILTGKRDLAILPDSAIAKAKIVNLNFPSGIHGFEVVVRLVSSPAIGTDVIESALLNTRAVLSIPRPTIRVSAIEDGMTEYEVTAFVDGLSASTSTQNELLDLIYRHAAASGIRLAPPRDRWPVQRENADAALMRSGAERVLDIVPLFAALTPQERAGIATKLRQLIYEKGGVVLREGTVLKSLFIVGRGVLSVASGEDDAAREAVRLGPGDHYGEIGLLTGTPAAAHITALTPAIV
jgi:hypothetical protein